MPHESNNKSQLYALIYDRVSSKPQEDGYSLSTQLDGCRAFCESLDYDISIEIEDVYTGTSHHRPGMDQLLERVAVGDIDVVVAWDLDRLLGRDELGQVLIKHQIFDAGARIEYARDGSRQEAESSEGELLAGFKALIARQENLDRTERSRRGQRGRIDAGHVLIAGSGPPYGYDYSGGKKSGELVVNDEEAAIVRDIYRWLIIEGLSCHAIALRLTAMRVPTRNDKRRAHNLPAAKQSGDGVWHPRTVSLMLANPAYKGEWTYGTTRRVKRRSMVKPDGTRYKTRYKQVKTDPSEWLVVPVPPIVDVETWKQAQEQLKVNKQYAKKPTREYLLRGMVFCPGCGNRWSGHWRREGDAYYRCSNMPNNEWTPDCDARYGIRQDVLEPAVWEYVTERLLEPDNLLMDVDRRRREEATEQQKHEREVRAVNTEIQTIDRRLSEMLDQVLDGFPADVIDAKRKELVEERERLIAERDRLEAQQVQVTITKDVEAMLRDLSAMIQQVLPEMTFEERRQLLRLLRLRVDVIDREQVKVSGILSEAVLRVSSG